MIEHERSYIFTHDGINELLSRCQLQWSKECNIVDYYISKDTRIRHYSYMPSNDSYFASVLDQWVLTHKKGSKSDGYRFEDEIEIDSKSGEILSGECKFSVTKERWKVHVDSERPYKVTVDYVTSPLQMAALEIEAGDPISMPIPVDITDQLFNADLIECPLSTWDYHNRKIAFCGAPSCGKTETAKWLSHALNTRFKSNSFYVTEYATSFIQKYNRHPEFQDQMLVWYGQWKREQNASSCGNLVISDCPTFLSYIYARILHDGPFNDKDALQLSKIYKQSLFDVNSYSNVFFLEMQEYVDNGIRYQTSEEALEIQNRVKMFLEDHKIQHRAVTYNDGEEILKEVLYLNE